MDRYVFRRYDNWRRVMTFLVLPTPIDRSLHMTLEETPKEVNWYCIVDVHELMQHCPRVRRFSLRAAIKLYKYSSVTHTLTLVCVLHSPKPLCMLYIYKRKFFPPVWIVNFGTNDSLRFCVKHDPIYIFAKDMTRKDNQDYDLCSIKISAFPLHIFLASMIFAVPLEERKLAWHVCPTFFELWSMEREAFCWVIWNDTRRTFFTADIRKFASGPVRRTFLTAFENTLENVIVLILWTKFSATVIQ